MKKRVLLLSCIIAGSLPSFGQTLVNKAWDAFCATPDTIDVVQTVIDPSGRLVMTGNTKTPTQQNNALTVVRNADGTTAWGQSFNGASNGSDYGTSVTFDASGNIYVGGATYSAATASLDYLVLKYSSAGSLLWSATYNGPGNGYDVVSGIVVNAMGEVFVTGASKGTGNFANLDYATIKYNTSGVQQWVSRYNYLTLPDVPCGLALDNSGNIFVAGGSANSITGSDIFVIKYNSVGTQTASYRHTVSSGNGWDKATAFTLDAGGNVFVTGSVYQNNTTCDMRTIKLNNTLVLQWSATYNGENRDDCANSLALDGSGNVCITGFTAKVAGGKDFTTIKYDASGNELWVRRQPSLISWHNGEARKVKADNSGNFFITGEMDCNGNKDFLVLKYDADGNKKWEQYFNGAGNGTDKAFDLNLSGDAIYVSGKTATATGDQYGTVKYEKLEKMPGVGTFQGNQYVTGEVTVRFAPDVLILSAIDDKDKQFGIVQEFVNDSTIQKMNAKLRTNVTKWKMAKIFPDLLTTDTISISCVGEDVRIPTFWAAFRIFPEGIADTVAMDSLNKIPVDIWYAEVMPIINLQTGANDPNYATGQPNLHPTATYPNANINIEPAWDIQVGQPFIRIGVYDSGIDQTHDELNNGKVEGGYDFFDNTSLSNPSDMLGHGTACAGVIGAYRNNITGIAGIAGGDGTVNNPGIKLYDCRINSNDSTFASVNIVNQAIVEGATSQSAGGFGLQVMSHSWVSSNSQLLMEAVRYAHANAVVFVAARGNFGLTTGNQLYFPACYYDPQVISVGSSGTNGDYQTSATGGDAYESNYQNVDLVAPGTSQIIQTTQFNTNGYMAFNGTSAAAPHVAGVAGLMLSEYNQPVPSTLNLAPEDVQHIMQLTAIDITTAPAAPGFDDHTGAGRLNAGGALQGIKPGYRVHHYSDFQNQGFSIVPTQLSSNAIIVNSFNQLGIPAGIYQAETFKVTHTFTISDIAPSETILGVWARTSSTLGIGPANPLDATPYCNIISYSSTQMVIETFVYHFYQSGPPAGPQCNYWIPTNFPAGTRCAATIYTYDPTFVGVQEQSSGTDALNVFPNPAGDAVNVGFTLDGAQQVRIEMFDVRGRIVNTEEEERYVAGYHQVTMSTGNLADGLYIVKMTTDNGVVQKKIIVQHNGL